MRRPLLGLACLGAILGSALAEAAPRKPSVRWRVEGGDAALTPTARVRLDVVNELPAEAAQPQLGLVQVMALLHAAGDPAAGRLAEAAHETGLRPIPPPDAAPGAPRVSIEPSGVTLDDLPVAVLLGRAVAVLGDPADATAPLLAARADPSDLDDRRRWTPETLVPPGDSRRLWEGVVPVSVDRLYADYLAVRTATGPAAGVAASPSVPSAADATYEAGSVQSMARSRSPDTISLGTTLVQAAPPRLFPIRLVAGELHHLRLRAWLDGAGSFRLDLETVPPN